MDHFTVLAFITKSFSIASLFFFLFFLFLQFSGGTVKSFLGNVLRLVIKEARDQDLDHSLDIPKNISVKFATLVAHDRVYLR